MVKAPSRIFPRDDLGSKASRTTCIVPFVIKRSPIVYIYVLYNNKAYDVYTCSYVGVWVSVGVRACVCMCVYNFISYKVIFLT